MLNSNIITQVELKELKVASECEIDLVSNFLKQTTQLGKLFLKINFTAMGIEINTETHPLLSPLHS